MSDLHLGARKSQVRRINEFLKDVDCENLYLVGDVIDIWRIKQLMAMKSGTSKRHFACVNRVLKLARRGTRVVYVTGNHDEFLNFFVSGEDSGRLVLAERIVHQSPNGGSILVIHGHQFDLATRFPRFLLVMGDVGYDLLLRLNSFVNMVRRTWRGKQWSLARYLKRNLKQALNFTRSFEETAVEYARRRGHVGVICGHIHTPTSKWIDGTMYWNTGCWTEELNCSYLVENWDGSIELRTLEQE